MVADFCRVERFFVHPEEPPNGIRKSHSGIEGKAFLDQEIVDLVWIGIAKLGKSFEALPQFADFLIKLVSLLEILDQFLFGFFVGLFIGIWHGSGHSLKYV